MLMVETYFYYSGLNSNMLVWMSLNFGKKPSKKTYNMD